MAEYLDKTGLTYLWSKLKEKFNTIDNYESNNRKYELICEGGPTTNAEFTLNKSISNYKEIVIACMDENYDCYGTTIISVDLFRAYTNNNKTAFGVSTYTSKRMYVMAKHSSDTLISIQSSDWFKIWGVK